MTWSCDDSVSGTLGRHMLLWLSFQGSYFALSSIIEAWFIVYLFNMRIPVPVFILTLADCYRKFLYPLPQSTTSSISHPSQWHAESYTDRDLLRSYFRKHRKDLRLAQPPKRLFAGVQSWAHGGEDDLDPGGVHWDLVDSCWLCLVRNSTNDGDVVAQHAKCTDTMWYHVIPILSTRKMFFWKSCVTFAVFLHLCQTRRLRPDETGFHQSFPYRTQRLSLHFLVVQFLGSRRQRWRHRKVMKSLLHTVVRCFFSHSVEVICCIYVYITIISVYINMLPLLWAAQGWHHC